MKRGFTLIEVLVVVAIVAMLVAILLPSLARAREQARTATCMSNMSNMPKAVLMFAESHRGHGQLLADVEEVPPVPGPGTGTSADPSYSIYAYQRNLFNRPGTYLKAWPVAYAMELGLPSLKRSEEYFSQDFYSDPSEYFTRFPKADILVCPADHHPVNTAYFPMHMFGLFSYAINEDVFGYTRPASMGGEGQPWKDGESGDGPGIRAKRLEGQIDKILRPSEVALFTDGGSEKGRDQRQTEDLPPLLLTNGDRDASSSRYIRGPYVENYEAAWGRLPHLRHSKQGGLAVALADGSAKYIRPIQWVTRNGEAYVAQYAPRKRVSPYNVGQIRCPQP